MVRTRSNTDLVEHKESPASPSDAEAVPRPTDTEAASTSNITIDTGATAVPTTSLTAPTADNDVTLRPQGDSSSHRSSSKASTKKRQVELLKMKEELAKKREELAQRQLETTEARFAILQCQADSENEEEEVRSVISNLQRTETWVNRQAQEHEVHPAGTHIVSLTAPVPVRSTLAGPLAAATRPDRAYEPPPPAHWSAAVDVHGAPPAPPLAAAARPDRAYEPPPPAHWSAAVDAHGAPPAPPLAAAVRPARLNEAPPAHWSAAADVYGAPSAPPLVTGAHPARSYEPPPAPLHQAQPQMAGAQNYRDFATTFTEAAHQVLPSWRPAVELPAFSGASSEWLVFKTAFYESARYFSEHDNLARLRRCLKGPAKEAVQCLFVSSTTTVEVLEILASRFGRPVAICMAEEEKLRHLPRLVDCPRDICVYATRLKNIVATIQALGKPTFLYNATLVHQITEGFPSAIRHQFYEFSCSQPSDTPELVLLGNFMSHIANRMSQFAPAEVISSGEPSAVRQPKRAPPMVRTHHVTEASTSPSVQVQPSGKCPICGAEEHRAKDCTTMRRAEPEERWVLAKKHRLCFRCLKIRKFKHTCKTTQCTVSGCKYTHHPLLHDPNYKAQVETTAHVVSANEESTEVIIAAVKSKARNAYLQVVPVCVSGPNGEYDTYALLDLGSTSTLIETSVAEAVGARGWRDPFYGELVCGSNFDASTSKRVGVSIRGRDSDKSYGIWARTVDNLGLSSQAVPADLIQSYPHMSDLTEKLLLEEARPTVLVGVDHHSLADARQLREGKERDQLAAVLTDLGWTLYGARSAPQRPQHTRHIREHIFHMREQFSEDEEINDQVSRLKNEVTMHDLMRKHFALECLGVEKKRPYTDGEQRALDLLDKYTRQIPAGGYETCLPWRSDNLSPPDNRSTAMKRLELVEKKLDRLPEMKKRYHEQMKNMLNNGYAELAPNEAPVKRWYLPHFGVVHPEKPEKLRIVHDAAAVTKGVSLNSLLLPGPDLLQSLPGVLMRFRQHPVAVTADIKDMFLRVTIREEDRDMQRFLWREDPRAGPPLEYRMKSVIFGATSSPFTAIFVKNQNAKRFEAQYPEAAKAIVRSHYVDDYLVSFADEEEATRISRQVDEIHRQGNFHLSKWSSNSPQVVKELSTESAATSYKLELDPTKVLGMVWDPQTDTLSFNLNETRIDGSILRGVRTPTKREALRATMSIYDPLGLATPITIQAKRILQDVWRSEIDWDAPLHPNEAEAWTSWGQHVMRLPKLAIPRCYAHFTSGQVRELHTFVDASSTAYAAAVYWRVTNGQGMVYTSLVTAKARVAPIGKVHTIPRLELQAAVLGCRLAQTAQSQHDLAPTKCFYWSDSKTVLTWLRNGARVYKPFVAHRIAEIHEVTNTSEWRWVPTKDNVADDATRSIPDKFGPDHRWFHGPTFLGNHPDSWPGEDSSASSVSPDPEAMEEEKTYTLQERERLSEALPKVERFSEWRRLIRATARVLMFIAKLRPEKIYAQQHKDADWKPPGQRKGKSSTSATKPKSVIATAVQTTASIIPAEFLIRAEALWVRAIQEETFKNDLRRAGKGERHPTSSRLVKLATVIDDAGVLRLRSRVARAENITPTQREPAVLPGEHPWVRLYVAHVHKQMHHGGRDITANEIRQQYWVLQLRKVVKEQVSKCLFCRIRRAKPYQPSTGNHPETRLAHHRPPFTFTGVDYFGPLMVTVGRSRQKRYGVLFTCLTTRAVHLELAGSLSTSSAIMALRRFIARRGCPSEIHSDNGTNFRGADKELRQAAQNALVQEASSKAIRWRFIPPGAPFMGGAWERLVRSVKTALSVVLQERAPHEEVLETLLAEAEHTVNSRPLTNVTSNPDDPEALTPNHFLLGGPSRVPQPGIFSKDDEAGYSKTHWRQAQRLADLFWSRWVREYLPELQHRREPQSKGGPIKLGDLVLVADGNLPRNQWPRGVVAALCPGTDGEIRVVDVRLAGGRVLRRPTKKLVVLPLIHTPASSCGGR